METACAGIVLYNPDFYRLQQVLNAVSLQVSRVILVDNGSNNVEQVTTLLEQYKIARLVRLGENRGIAAALNVACDIAQQEGYEQILTLDQDTVIERDMVQRLMPLAGEGTGIVCPRVAYEGNEEFQPQPRDAVEIVEWAITSGSLTSLKAWKEVEGFDERMFIDGVDRDFCLRLRRKGWNVKRVNDAVMHHKLGELKCRRLLGRTIYATNHPAWRRYYMARNRVYLCRKGLVGFGEAARWAAKEISKVVLFEKNGISKSAAIIRGVRDGFTIPVSKC